MPERILILAAHPDDETIGAGASIARWVSEGHEVFVWFATDGVSSRENMPESSQTRRESSMRALEVLGVSEGNFAEFPDNALDTVGRLRVCKAMEQAAQRFRPSKVLTHSQADLNVDHRIVGECAAVIARPSPTQSITSLWHFEVPSSTGWFSDSVVSFTPTHFVEIGDFMRHKVTALREYGPEIPEWPHARSARALNALAERRGSEAGVSLAEAFFASRELSRLSGWHS